MSEDECVNIGACIPVNSAKEKPTQSTHHNLVMNSLPPCQELRSGRPIEHERNAPVRFMAYEGELKGKCIITCSMADGREWGPRRGQMLLSCLSMA